MDPSFSSSLQLNRMSISTAVVLWTMIIFLVLLIVGIGTYFKQELNKKKDNEKRSLDGNDPSGKGF